MIARRLALTLLVLPALLASCRKPTVEAYRVPKETAAQNPATAPDATPASAPSAPSAAPFANGAAAASSPGMANTAVATAAGPGLTWTAPATWKTKAGSAMRKGSYTVTAAGVAGEGDLSITAFPGDVGGDLANLNRWRGQIQLPPVAQGEFEAAVQRIERNGLRITIADIAGSGAGAQRILGAMIPHNGATWFFKLMGPDAVLAKEKASFMAFLDTIKAAQ